MGFVDDHQFGAGAEELGATATITGLRVVSWLPPWRGWDDAMLYVFEATLDRSSDDFTLQRKEIAGIHHVAPGDLDDHVAAYTAKVIRQAIAAKANITYKILYNDAVAMTGGQPLDGTLGVSAISRELHAEGDRVAAPVGGEIGDVDLHFSS